MSELIFLLLLFGLPAALGVVLAWRRGKNPVLWGVLSGVFPFFLVVLYMQYKPVAKGTRKPDGT
ncbi:MAG TPA: hypothetical protein VF795_11290 [Desulfuromonadaceae bacterium]